MCLGAAGGIGLILLAKEWPLSTASGICHRGPEPQCATAQLRISVHPRGYDPQRGFRRPAATQAACEVAKLAEDAFEGAIGTSARHLGVAGAVLAVVDASRGQDRLLRSTLQTLCGCSMDGYSDPAGEFTPPEGWFARVSVDFWCFAFGNLTLNVDQVPHIPTTDPRSARRGPVAVVVVAPILG